jgi:tetratricopeptide (TPR) repeat protein
VVERAPRPELGQALGDLCVLDGDPERAEPWHDLALTGYLESVERGGVHYYHHLAGFPARVGAADAVRWARADVELRRNFATLATLARALHRAGRVAEAAEAIEEALASGARDAHLLSAAGTIYVTAGREAEGERLLEDAARLNPRRGDFHVHR